MEVIAERHSGILLTILVSIVSMKDDSGHANFVPLDRPRRGIDNRQHDKRSSDLSLLQCLDRRDNGSVGRTADRLSALRRYVCVASSGFLSSSAAVAGDGDRPHGQTQRGE